MLNFLLKIVLCYKNLSKKNCRMSNNLNPESKDNCFRSILLLKFLYCILYIANNIDPDQTALHHSVRFIVIHFIKEI